MGHSLGAGTAAILCILLRREFPATTCFSFSPPGGLLRYRKYRGGQREKKGGKKKERRRKRGWRERWRKEGEKEEEKEGKRKRSGGIEKDREKEVDK